MQKQSNSQSYTITKSTKEIKKYKIKCAKVQNKHCIYTWLDQEHQPLRSFPLNQHASFQPNGQSFYSAEVLSKIQENDKNIK